jgi:hypothetical protein
LKSRRSQCASTLLALALTATNWLIPAQAAAAPVIRTSDQGLHRIAVPGGQLIAIKGTYQDTQRYKRSLSFFFQATNKGEWQHVPVVESETDYTTEWFHSTEGETTMSDAVIVRGSSAVFLIVVDKLPGKNAYKVARYAFGEADDSHPDGPAYLFIRRSLRTVTGRASDSVETMLDKEAASIK